MTTQQAAYCGHAECQQAVNEWIAAGRPDLPDERGSHGQLTHHGEVIFYARRDWLADSYQAAIAEGRGYTDAQRDAHVMRDREQRRKQWRTVRPRNRSAAA